jgi:hypothetical protein
MAVKFVQKTLKYENAFECSLSGDGNRGGGKLFGGFYFLQHKSNGGGTKTRRPARNPSQRFKKIKECNLWILMDKVILIIKTR